MRLPLTVESQNLPANGLHFGFDGATQTVTVAGTVPDRGDQGKDRACDGDVGFHV